MSQTGLTLAFIYRGQCHVPDRSYTGSHLSMSMPCPRQRIGNGKNVFIWGDAWVPGSDDFRVQNLNANSSISIVTYLIDANTRKWKTKLIYNTFLEKDAERILCIPLSMSPHEDHLIWHSEPTGEYTKTPGICNLSKVSERSGNERTFVQGVSYSKGDMGEVRMIACVLWAIWTSRNRFIHEGEIKSGSQIADFVSNYLKELDGLHTNLPARRFHMGRWVALNGLRLKINFDAAFNKRRNESCSGLVVLNLGLYVELREVEIEGDSRSVIQKLQEEKEDRSKIEVSIKDSKQLSLGFEFCVFQFIHRKSNKIIEANSDIGIIGNHHHTIDYLLAEARACVLAACNTKSWYTVVYPLGYPLI
ncbi:hypothetical protein CXB51_019141 [Gossypium anomalum]|uniref:RNase H type-1 domain-containing protein n=1 Tax=Gossypium anomalum TaxID=47600 RepID=A0A8J5YNC6_9ROSI|nr:hypothetical protein CXB51_019141 [Gossypium anomalum]